MSVPDRPASTGATGASRFMASASRTFLRFAVAPVSGDPAEAAAGPGPRLVLAAAARCENGREKAENRDETRRRRRFDGVSAVCSPASVVPDQPGVFPPL